MNKNKEKIKNDMQVIKEKINTLLGSFKSDTPQDFAIVKHVTTLREFLDDRFLQRVNLLPEIDDGSLDEHYKVLQKELQQFEEIISNCKAYTESRKFENYIRVIKTELKQNFTFPTNYNSDSQLKMQLENIQVCQEGFILNQTSFSEETFLFCEQQISMYHQFKNASDKRLFELEASHFKLYASEKQKQDLLNQRNQLMFDLVQKQVKTTEKITTQVAAPKNSSFNLVAEYQEAEKNCQKDIADLNKEIEVLKQVKDLQEKIKSKIKAEIKLKNNVFEFDETTDEILKEFQSFQEKFEKNHPEILNMILDSFDWKKGMVLSTINDIIVIYNDYISIYNQTEEKLRARQNTLEHAATQFNELQSERAIYFQQFQALIKDTKNLQWSPYKQLPQYEEPKYLHLQKFVNLKEKYDTAAQLCKQDINKLKGYIRQLTSEINNIKEEKAKQAQVKNALPEQQSLTTETYLKKIKDNHKKYLEENMVPNLKHLAKKEQVITVQQYLDRMKDYHESKNDYLKYAIEQPSLLDKLGGGALSALLGVGAGAGAFFATKKSSSSQLEDVAAGSLSTVLGAIVGYTAYQAWIEAEKKPADDHSRNEFDEAMKKAGFNSDKYKELSAEVVKLFHFRECLLLGLEDNTGTNIGEEFKNELKKFLSVDEVDQKSFEVAIEVYMLNQLNLIFEDAFKKIYEIHDKEITEAKEEAKNSPIIAWIKKYFENPEERKKFTQQMQVEFMGHCINYLKSEMNEPGFLNRHPFLISSSSGLIVGAFAIGVASIILGGPIGIGVLGIAFFLTCLSALTTYLIVTQVKSFKRDEGNRNSIQEAIDIVTEEKERLKLLIKVVTETTSHDLKQLAEYQDKNESGIATWIGLDENKNIALGASFAWIREHASRYRHSKLIEIDLEKVHTDIIEKAEKQTIQMQNLLVGMMSSDNVHPAFKKFIQDTKIFLTDAKNKEFITNFDLLNKVKEQILQIVSVVPVDSRRELPAELVSFYIQDLGGSAQDLLEVRQFTSFTAVETEENHPHKQILKIASVINEKILTKENQTKCILGGNYNYREMLGLRPWEEKINEKNIDLYLKDSYEFLLLLLDYEKPQPKFNEKFIYSDEFLLYRMLFMKQLASLADPNNQHTNTIVRDKVRNFAQKTLNINPVNSVFNQFITHDLLYQDETSKLNHVAHAVILSLTYGPEKITPKALIKQEMSSFLQKHSEEIKLFYDESKTRLRPEVSQDYLRDIEKAISTTEQFVAEMETKSILLKSHTLEIYLNGVMGEVNDLLRQIEEKKPTFTGDLSPLVTAKSKLEEYKLKLSEKLKQLTFSVAPHEFLTNTMPKYKQMDLDQFISDVSEHIKTLSNSFHSSKGEEQKLALELLTALRTLKVDEVNYEYKCPQLKNSMYLKDIVTRNLTQMGYKSLDELFMCDQQHVLSLQRNDFVA